MHDLDPACKERRSHTELLKAVSRYPSPSPFSIRKGFAKKKLVNPQILVLETSSPA